MTVDDETGEVSSGRLPTAIVTKSISRKTKSQRKPGEKSEEAIVPLTIETTELDVREGSLLQPGPAVR